MIFIAYIIFLAKRLFFVFSREALGTGIYTDTATYTDTGISLFMSLTTKLDLVIYISNVFKKFTLVMQCNVMY